MTRHILILGNNLTGLITAYRLLHLGFRISIIDPPAHAQPTAHVGTAQKSPELTAPLPSFPTDKSRSIPLILHGFYHSTWALFQELSFEWPPQTLQPVGIEFVTEEKKTMMLPKSSRRAWLHPLARFTLFKGLSWSDRWHVINFLEKQWEDNLLPNHNPDIESVDAWLISAKQSERSRSNFWNPLCRFFLKCNVPQASLGAFFEVLSQYWFGQPTDAATFLAPPETLRKLRTELRELLMNKGVRFHSTKARFQINTDAKGIQSMEVDENYIKAQAYISALTPQNLLPLLPERALARYANFSSLGHIPEVYGRAIEFTLQESFSSPRLILNSDPFDWITSQPCSELNSPKTMVTCVTLHEAIARENSEEWLIHKAWDCLPHHFNLSSVNTQESCQPRIIRQVGPFFPCQRGSRAYRPIPTTPLSNFFLAGPWTATNLPSSLESTIKSANQCAQAVAASFYTTTR